MSLARASFAGRQAFADGRDLSGATHRASERHPHAFPRLGRVSGVGVLHFPGTARSAWSSGCTHAVTDDNPPAASRQSLHRTNPAPTVAGTAKASVSSREPAS